MHPADTQQVDVWRLAREVATTLNGLPWVLIGGLMVQLLEAERDVISGFSTGDVDVMLDVRGDGAFDLPVPTLIGAIVLKVRVVENAAGRTSLLKHERDLARLLALVEDPDAEGADLTSKEHGYLRARIEMADSGHRAWRGVRNPLDGIAALRILSDSHS